MVNTLLNLLADNLKLREGLQWKSRNEAKRNEELQRKARPKRWQIVHYDHKRWKGARPKLYD